MELPKESDVGESEVLRPNEQTRYVAAWLETCAGRCETLVGRWEIKLHCLEDGQRP